MRIPLALLVGFGLMVAAVTAAWILADDSLQSFNDSAHQHILALQVSRALHRQGLAAAWLVLLGVHVAWPPGLFALHGLGAYLAGEGFHAMRLANLLYIPLLMWVVHALGRRWGDARTAALAAMLTVSTLGVAFHLRHICIDTPSMVLVPLAMLALTLTTRGCQPRTWALFGVVCGVGLLFRVQFLFFVAAPAAVMAGWQLWKADSSVERLRLLKWMALGTAAALLISSPYWAIRPRLFLTVALSHVGIYLPYQGLMHQQGPSHQLNLGEGLLYYALIIGKLVGWPMVLVLLGTLPRLLRRRPQTALLLLCVGGGYLAYAATISREPRYLLPAVPVLVLLATLGLEQLSQRARVILSVLVLLGTAGPTLILAGNRRRLADWPVVAWLFHHEQIRRPQSWNRPQVAAALAAALRGRISRKPTADTNMLLMAKSMHDETSHLYVHLPSLPRVDRFTPHESLRDISFAHWRATHKVNTNYYLVSWGREFNLPPVWKGTLGPRPIMLYEVPLHDLKRVIKTQAKLITPAPDQEKKP